MVTVEGAKLLMFQDVFILQTPGGGGWGSPDQTPDHAPVPSSVLSPVLSTVSKPVLSTVSKPVPSTVSKPVLSTVSRPVLSRGSVAEYRRLQESA